MSLFIKTTKTPTHGKQNLILLFPLVKLQVISLEGWTDIMYYVQDAHSFWDWVYFVLLIVVSMINLLFLSWRLNRRR